MRDKKEIPKYHKCGSVKYYYGKLHSTSKKEATQEVTSFSDIHLINLSKENNEKNITSSI